MIAGSRLPLLAAATALLWPSAFLHAQDTRPNPLLTESTLAYRAPPFDVIRDTDYEAALVQGMAEQRGEIQRIVGNPQPATFQNTIEALERSGALLNRVSRIFNALVQANTNPTLQKTDVALAPKLAAHRD